MLQRLWQGIGRTNKKLELVARASALGQIESAAARDQEDAEVDEAAAAFGLIPVRAEEVAEPLYLWPENLLSWNLFIAVSTQWIVGANGAVGLNYPGVEVVMRKWRIRRKDEQRLFSDIQAMERATLRAWGEIKK